MSVDLDVFLQTDVGEFCKEIGKLISQRNPRKRSIIIKYFGDNSKRNDQTDKLLVGANVNNGFAALYYNENLTQIFKNIEQYVHSNRHIIINVWNEMKKQISKTKIKSFLIYYGLKNRKINICYNRIGNQSIPNSRIFNEFLAPA